VKSEFRRGESAIPRSSSTFPRPTRLPSNTGGACGLYPRKPL
jgi:hypothetical protein